MTTASRLSRNIFWMGVLSFLPTLLFAHFSVTPYGHFKKMIEQDDVSAHVLLTSFEDQAEQYGLGAMQGLMGEIMILGGKVYISRGSDEEGVISPLNAKDSATILASATVSDWLEFPISEKLNQAQFERFVKKTAHQHGLSLEAPFPFQVKGKFEPLKWHVINGHIPRAKRVKGHAIKKDFNESSTKGTLLGFYTGSPLEGVVSHIGKRFHIHYLNDTKTQMGHVDAYVITQHASLLLPKVS